MSNSKDLSIESKSDLIDVIGLVNALIIVSEKASRLAHQAGESDEVGAPLLKLVQNALDTQLIKRLKIKEPIIGEMVKPILERIPKPVS